MPQYSAQALREPVACDLSDQPSSPSAKRPSSPSITTSRVTSERSRRCKAPAWQPVTCASASADEACSAKWSTTRRRTAVAIAWVVQFAFISASSRVRESCLFKSDTGFTDDHSPFCILVPDGVANQPRLLSARPAAWPLSWRP